MMDDPEIVLAFIEEIAEYLPQLRQHLNKLSKKPGDKDALEEAYRLAHTIKGSAAMMEQPELSAVGRDMEQTLLPVTEKKASFTPDMGIKLLAAVDRVEALLDRMGAQASGTPEPAVPVFVPPVVQTPPVRPVQTPNLNVPPPPPAWFAGGMAEPAPNVPPPPAPPPVKPFNIFEDDDADLPFPGFSAAPPPPIPPANRGFSVAPPPPSKPAAPPNVFDFDFFDDEPVASREPRAASHEPVVSNPPSAFSFQPSNQSRAASYEPNVSNPQSSILNPIQQSSIDEEVDLMDLLMEPNGLEALEATLFPNESTFAPADPQKQQAVDDLLDSNNRLEFDFNIFDAPLEVVPPEKVEIVSSNPPLNSFEDTPTVQPSQSREALPDFDFKIEGLGELDDILATGAVDRQINDLQGQIGGELSSQMTEFESVPLVGDIGIHNNALLEALGEDITNSRLQIYDAGQSPVLRDFDLPIEHAELGGEPDALHDFRAAEDLLAQLGSEPTAPAVPELRSVAASDAPVNFKFELPPTDGFDFGEPLLPDTPDMNARPGENLPLSDTDYAHENNAPYKALPDAPLLESFDASQLPPDFHFDFEAGLSDEETRAAMTVLHDDMDVPDFAFAPLPTLPQEENDAEIASVPPVEDAPLGALFLGEAHADIATLKNLVVEFDAPETDKTATAARIGEISTTLRKAAEMMDLGDVARQAGVLENTAELVTSGELGDATGTSVLFRRSLNELLTLLAPYRKPASEMFDLPLESTIVPLEANSVQQTSADEQDSTEFRFELPDAPPLISQDEPEAAAFAGFDQSAPALTPEFSPEAVMLLAAELQEQGMGEDEAIEAAMAQLSGGDNAASPVGKDFSADELADAGLMTGDDQLGAFFLAEAQSDIDKLKELVADFGAPDGDREADAARIGQITETLRKAAEMMDLQAVAAQAGSLELLAQEVASGENTEPGNVFEDDLNGLLALLAPYEAEAKMLFAAPAEAVPTESAPESDAETAETVPDSDEPEIEFSFEPAVAAPLPSVSRTAQTVPLPEPSEIDPELAEVFAAEAEEHIQNLDTRLAALENDPQNRELIREIRRTAHTLKGSAAMLSFGVISQTAHLMEDLLDRLYDGTTQVTPDVVELLFTTFNGMDTMVRDLAAGKPENLQILADLRPRYATLLTGAEPEEAAEGGAIIFQPKAATPVAARPRQPETVDAREMDEDEVVALEAAMVAAETESETATEAEPEAAEVSTKIVARPVAAPIVPSGAGLDTDLSVKIPLKRLDTMMNQIGEMVINRTVLERRNDILNRTINEFELSLRRLQRVSRELETRYEVELLKNSAVPVGVEAPLYAGHGNGNGNGNGGIPPASALRPEFDTLEMDQYTEFHTLSREMTETVDDLGAALRELANLKADLDSAVLQQARLTDDLQDRVVKVRLVPVSNLTPRIYRTVRSVAATQQKDVQFVVSGEQTQLDKTIFEEIGDPLLHLVRNAIDHGIESPAEREAAGKPRQATLMFAARTEGSQVVIEVREDGRGINLAKIRQRGIERGMIAADAQPTDDELLDLIFMPGFSTADSITDISGRGVGLDVVRANIARLKGTVEVHTEAGKGTTFSIRLPSTLAITRALLVKVAGYTYAVPLSSIERTIRAEAVNLEIYGERVYYRVDDATVPLLDMNRLLQLQPRHFRNTADEEEDAARNRLSVRREKPLLLVNNPERAVLQVDALLGQQEVVVKPLGSHLKFVPGVAGATILGSGEVILILNVYELVAAATGRRGRYSTLSRAPQSQPQVRQRATAELRRKETESLATPRRVPVIQVVDDSLSVRKVLSAALEKAGFRVRTSKDGQEALEMVQQNPPDLLVMDIEMPRMDGYELTSILKSRESFRHIPIVMLTSRAGLKHRQKAEEVGANGFLVKPYRENELLQIVSTLLTQ
jgi:chemosensory pili system protein ChpA (sensor histidine kinase/response regulator)